MKKKHNNPGPGEESLEAEQQQEEESAQQNAEERQEASEQSAPPVVMPQAASTSFYLTVNCTYPAGASQIGQASTFQLVTPWGQSTACINLLDAFNQMVASGSTYSGQMWNFLANGVTRGLVTTGGATVPQSASYFSALP